MITAIYASFMPKFIRFFRHLHWGTIKQAFISASQHRLTGLSAEMAYNAMLALFPSILVFLTAIGLFETPRASFERLAMEISQVAPKEALNLIQDFTQEISSSHNQGLFSLSFLGAIWASSAAISAAMIALDQIQRTPWDEWRPFWKAKLISLGLTIGTLILLLTASFGMFICDRLILILLQKSQLLILLSLWRLLSWPIVLIIISGSCALVYRYGPSRWIEGTPIFPGAILSAISWVILSSSFRLYVSNFANYNRAYGVVGAFIVLMLWLYMSSLVLLWGHELNVTVGTEMQRYEPMSHFNELNSKILSQSTKDHH